jgi:two-component system chemotaxis response regulator CheB
MKVRVLVVDDSAFARKVIREALASVADVEVVDLARDGLEALEKIALHRPDVMTLDLVMPNLDGVGVLRALAGDVAAPRVVIVSMSDADSDLAVEALALGALELVHKPTALATDRLYEMSGELSAKVKAVAAARRPPRARPAPGPPPPPALRPRHELVAIGASTGGPQAVARLLAELPADFPVPILVALHLPAGYTESFARRLDETCALEVREAEDGLPLRAGLAVISRGGLHLKVRGGAGLSAALDVRPVDSVHRPSVDVLFESAVEVAGRGVMAVVLTGMGDDGVRGARLVRAAGGTVLTEAERTCVVYGMPRAVREAGLSDEQRPLDEMAAAITRRL